MTKQPYAALIRGLMVSTPVIHVHGLLLIYRPRRDERQSCPDWLTHSGHVTHEVVTCQPQIRHRSGKVRQPKTDVLTTEPMKKTPEYVNVETCNCRLLADCSADAHVQNDWRSSRLLLLSRTSSRTRRSAVHSGWWARIFFARSSSQF